MGEIFKIFPWVQILDQMIEMIKEMYSNPINIVSAASGCLCGGCSQVGGYDYCKQGKQNGVLYPVCTFLLTAAKVGDAIASWQGIIDAGGPQWTTSNVWCDEAEDLAS